MTYIHRCMIVPVGRADLARELVLLLGGESAGGMFTTGLSNDGDEPFTHYISTGMVDTELAAALNDPSLMAAWCVSKGRQITVPACTQLLAACDIAEEDPHGVLERKALKPRGHDQAAQVQAVRGAANKA